MPDFIQAVRASKYARPFNWFMHGPSGGPSTPDGFQPTHSQKRTYPFERLLKFREPINLSIYHSTMINRESDERLFGYRSTQICAWFINGQNLTNSRLNAFIAKRHRQNRIINQPTMLGDPISNRKNTFKRSFQSKGIMQGLEYIGTINTTMGQNQPKWIEGGRVSYINKYIPLSCSK